jgi:hypothetical protein
MRSPTYFERFPSAEAYRDAQRLIQWYGDKCPRLRAQWQERIRQYEAAKALEL